MTLHIYCLVRLYGAVARMFSTLAPKTIVYFFRSGLPGLNDHIIQEYSEVVKGEQNAKQTTWFLLFSP